jgi:hypothetical protein
MGRIASVRDPPAPAIGLVLSLNKLGVASRTGTVPVRAGQMLDLATDMPSARRSIRFFDAVIRLFTSQKEWPSSTSADRTVGLKDC